MKIAIIGSREYKHIERVINYVKTLPQDTIIVSGGAWGVDSAAETEARSLNLGTEIYKPEYDKYPGYKAPLIRNRTIVDNADMVVAFWNGISGGTKYTVDYAKSKNKTVVIFDDTEEVK